jgi:hypothetical protein
MLRWATIGQRCPDPSDDDILTPKELLLKKIERLVQTNGQDCSTRTNDTTAAVAAELVTIRQAQPADQVRRL